MLIHPVAANLQRIASDLVSFVLDSQAEVVVYLLEFAFCCLVKAMIYMLKETVEDHAFAYLNSN